MDVSMEQEQIHSVSFGPEVLGYVHVYPEIFSTQIPYLSVYPVHIRALDKTSVSS